MSIVARTNLDAVAIGDIDALWKPDGRHTCPARQNAAGIGVQLDPFGGGFKVCGYHLKSGCGLFGGDRAETLSSKIGGWQGSRLQVGATVAIPPNFRANGSQWNYLGWNFHNTNSVYSGNVDVGGAEQSPVVLQVRNDHELWIHINSGKRTPDGKQGTFYVDEHIADFVPSKYMNIIMDVAWSAAADGYLAIYADRKKVFEKACPTLDAGAPNNVYGKWGAYRPPNNGLDADYYYRDVVAFNGKDASEALAFFGGGAIPPPAPTAAELRDKAVAELQQTTIGWDDWQANIAAGDYPDVSKTHWAKGLAYLNQIGL